MSMHKYLDRYAEPDSADYIDSNPLKRYQNCIVIPLYDEAKDCLEQVFRHVPTDNCLVIAVVNSPTNANQNAQARSCELYRHILGQTNVLCVNRCTDGKQIPHKQGVGLARKLGSDIALRLFADGRIKCPWIYQTDADATLPSQYFLNPPEQRGMCVFRHRHVSQDPHLALAAQLYDQHMAYYVDGLHWAQSKYAYPTMGSAMAINVHTYAAVRGYPRKNAAEDFYLLNKAAKIHPVIVRDDITIEIQARTSARVPFGTGPALTKIINSLEIASDGSQYLSYHPKSFTLLRQAIEFLDQYSAQVLTANTKVAELLTALGFDKIAAKVHARYPDQARRHKVLQDWFDAFKTLRFIHEARRYYPDQPLIDCLSTTTWAQTANVKSANKIC